MMPSSTPARSVTANRVAPTCWPGLRFSATANFGPATLVTSGAAAQENQTPMRIPRYLLAALAAFMLSPASANASMTFGIQDDWNLALTGSAGTSLELARADTIHARSVRLSVSDGRWPYNASDYLRAARAAHDRGLQVLVTLTAWQTHPTAAQWQTFTANVVSQLAPYVDAWSPMNEPNIEEFRADQSTLCHIVAATHRSRVAVPSWDTRRHRRVVRYVRSRHGHWKRRHHRWFHVKHGHYRRVVKHQTRRARRIKVTRYEWRTQTTHWLDCHHQSRGEAYGAVYRAVSPIIRRLDPTALLVAGDLAPSADGIAFMRDASPLDADVFGVHPYYWHDPAGMCSTDVTRLCAIEPVVAWARSQGLPTWATEWGLRPNAPSSWWAEALNRMREAGIRRAFIYDTNSPGHWDTRMTEPALSAVAGLSY